MSKFVFYIKLEKFLAEWLVNALGDPVAFPPYSNENAVIRTFISKLPPGTEPQTAGEGLVAVRIPDSASKPPETYNHMGRRGQAAVREAVRDLFIRSLWNDLRQLEDSPVGINSLIAAWCESHGIALDRHETVRQWYYRARRKYAQQNINLKKSSRKSQP